MKNIRQTYNLSLPHSPRFIRREELINKSESAQHYTHSARFDNLFFKFSQKLFLLNFF
jgi:hypothetical protein